jgi:hypothetical protein
MALFPPTGTVDPCPEVSTFTTRLTTDRTLRLIPAAAPCTVASDPRTDGKDFPIVLSSRSRHGDGR